jgi:Ca2+-binding EF-hand superfamily protein
MEMQMSSRALCALIVLALTMPPVFQVAVADPPAGDVMSKYDADKDKTLSLDEVKSAAAAHFDRLDKDGDSTLEAKEVKGILGEKAFKAADTDHDGTLSKSEYLALVEKLFDRADANHDGTLTATELQSHSGQALKRLID